MHLLAAAADAASAVTKSIIILIGGRLSRDETALA